MGKVKKVHELCPAIKCSRPIQLGSLRVPPPLLSHEKQNLQGLAKWFTFSVSKNVGVVMFVVAERDNINFAKDP